MTSDDDALVPARLAGGVAAVALGLAGGLVFDDTRDAALFSGLAFFGLSSGKPLDFLEPCLFQRCEAFLLGCPDGLAFQTAFFAGGGDRLALGQPGRKLRSGSFARRAVVFKQRLFCAGRSIQSVG